MNLKLFIKKIISRDIDFDFVKNKLNKIQINQVTEFNDKLRNQNLNNLDDVPALGATVVVGQPSIQGGSGGPNRVMALV